MSYEAHKAWIEIKTSSSLSEYPPLFEYASNIGVHVICSRVEPDMILNLKIEQREYR